MGAADSPQPLQQPHALKLPASHQVHIWWRSLTPAPEDDQQALWAVLSNDERDRAARFVFERDRARFVLARATLRLLLSTYLGVAAGELGFQYGPYGKPYLRPEHRDTKLEFSVAHAHELVVYAVAVDGPVGVDIESIERAPDPEELASTVLAPAELAELIRMPERDRSRAFLTAWTRKEAYLKARGSGLTVDPRLVEVGLSAGGVRFVAGHEAGTEDAIESFVPQPGYIGALAAPVARAGAASPRLVIDRWPRAVR